MLVYTLCEVDNCCTIGKVTTNYFDITSIIICKRIKTSGNFSPTHHAHRLIHHKSPIYRMLIQYGLIRGLIRHLQKYPVLVDPDTTDATLPVSIQPYTKYIYIYSIGSYQTVNYTGISMAVIPTMRFAVN